MTQERTTSTLLHSRVSRRTALKAGGVAALGLAFSKPAIETLYPKPAFAQLSSPTLQATGCVTPPAGMVAWWTGDDHAMDIVGGHHGTLVNGAGYGPGMVAQGFSFNGNDQYVDIGTVVLGTTGPFSVDAWVKVNALSKYQGIVGEIGNENLPGQFTFRITPDGKVQFLRRMFGTTVYLVDTDAPVPLGVFNHLAGVYAGGTDLRVYVNGIRVSVSGRYDNYGTHEPARTLIGTTEAWQVALSEVTNPMNGIIDEVELFNRVLDRADIRRIYQAGSFGKCKEK